MNEQIWWYLARASGMVAWVALVASAVLGVLLATRALRPHDRPAWVLDLHRGLSATAVVCTALHLVGLVADSYVDFGWAEILVPGASEWRRTAVAIGVVATYGLAVVQLSSLVVRRLPRRLWRAIHLTSYLTVWAVSLHAGLAGTDVGNVVYLAVALVLTCGMAGVTVLRIVAGRARRTAGSRALESV